MAGDGVGGTSLIEFLSEEECAKSVVISDPARPDMPIIYVSEEFEAQTGYRPDEAIGRNCRFLQGPDTDPRAAEAIRRALSTRSEIVIDILNYRKDGTAFWNRLCIRPLFDERGRLRYFVGAQNPIAAQDARPGPIDVQVHVQVDGHHAPPGSA